MIPLKDVNPTRTAPVVTVLLIAACIAVYFFLEPVGKVAIFRHSTSAESAQEADADFSYHYAAIPCELVHDRPLTTGQLRAGCSTTVGPPIFPKKDVWLAVLFSMFLHGSLLHIGGNMLFLWIFGNNVEDRLGHVAYLIFYVVAGMVATAAYVVSNPSSTAPLLGASGAIAGVMGAYLVFFPRARVRTLVFLPPIILWPRIPAWVVLSLWVVSQFFVSPGSGVAWVAHVGGFVFGMLVASGLRNRVRTRPARWA